MKSIWIPFLVIATLVILAFVFFENLETYFTDLLQHVRQNPGEYSLLSFLVLTSDIILPVPNSIVMYLNGYVLGFWGGSLLSLLSLMLSCFIGYYLGKLGAFSIKNTAQKEAATGMVEKYGPLAIIISRGIPIISETVCIVTGLHKMPVKQYLIYNFLGYLPLCFMYAGCGTLGFEKDVFIWSFLMSILVSAIFWFVGKRLIQNRAD